MMAKYYINDYVYRIRDYHSACKCTLREQAWEFSLILCSCNNSDKL